MCENSSLFLAYAPGELEFKDNIFSSLYTFIVFRQFVKGYRYVCEPMRVLAFPACHSSKSIRAAWLPLWEVFPRSLSVSVSLTGMVTTWNCSSHFPASAATNTHSAGPMAVTSTLSLSHTHVHTCVLHKFSSTTPLSKSSIPTSYPFFIGSFSQSISPAFLLHLLLKERQRLQWMARVRDRGKWWGNWSEVGLNDRNGERDEL